MGGLSSSWKKVIDEAVGGFALFCNKVIDEPVGGFALLCNKGEFEPLTPNLFASFIDGCLGCWWCCRFHVSSRRLRAMVGEMGEEEVICFDPLRNSTSSSVSTASASQNELIRMKNTPRRQHSLKSSPLSVSIAKESTEVELSSRTVQWITTDSDFVVLKL
ncbi:hypothetical protein IEQ34_008614 [Dendrobium chrysotoxum]|uniref:Uncharacterized protein n=1 Tax=Dendrobium chrysotoxum TaxID=161865 RepID=A0AAV7GH19_DENCH|nr:hypothetical protein IEQ34_008614 [Dendrobium chrysotoxum]